MFIISFDIGICNMAYSICKVDKSFDIIKLEKIDLNCKKKDIQLLIDNVIEFLDEIYINHLFDKFKSLIVLIECQMNSVMKILQSVINTYFKLLSKYENVDIKTIYISPKHKNNLIKNYIDILPNDIIIKKDINKYKQNKIDSINFCKWILENKYINNDILNYFNSLKKKDDISDALLMSIYYYEYFIIK